MGFGRFSGNPRGREVAAQFCGLRLPEAGSSHESARWIFQSPSTGFTRERSEIVFSFLFMHECAGCESPEERVFTDSWTGKEFCFMCLSRIIDRITMSPNEDGGDNLPELMATL